MSTEQRSDPPAFTPLWEQRLIGAAKRGDRVAEAQLFDLYEPMVRRITGSLYLPGGEREDLAQEARLGILAAIRAWDPDRSVPFRCFAWLCAVREARMAVSAARAAKHQSAQPRTLAAQSDRRGRRAAAGHARCHRAPRR